MTQTPGDDFARLHAVVKGRVQGVYFRATTQHEAVARGLSGWVRNRWDGSVEVNAEGSKEDLEKLVVALKRGPRNASVTEASIDWGIASGEFSSFTIRRTD